MRNLAYLGLGLISGFVVSGPAAAQVDRYGGSPTPRAHAAENAPIYAAPKPAPGRALWWPGKGAEVQALQPGYSPAVSHPPLPQVAPAAYAHNPAPPPEGDGFQPLYPGRTPQAAAAPTPPPASPPPASLPTSIYAPAPPQAPAAAQSQAPATPAQTVAEHNTRRADGPRFYSVHRDFGIAPDAAPIPPQFFTATADLSEPPVEDRERRIITGANGQRTTVVRRSSGGAN